MARGSDWVEVNEIALRLEAQFPKRNVESLFDSVVVQEAIQSAVDSQGFVQVEFGSTRTKAEPAKKVGDLGASVHR